MMLGKTEATLKSLMGRGWLTTEMRIRINDAKVQQYASEMKDGDKFPSPVVFVDPKTEFYRVGDGFHRILAHRINKQSTIEIDLRRGRYLDAVLYNIEANRKQKGLPFSTGDLQKCIETLLRDEEASRWTQSKIADTVGCSVAYTSQVVKKLGIERPSVIVDKNGHARHGLNTKKDTKEVAKRREKVGDMYLKGYPKYEIAEKFGIGRSTVERDIELALQRQEFIECPHCNGTGKVRA